MKFQNFAPFAAGLGAMLVCLIDSSSAYAQYNHPAYRPHSRSAVLYPKGLYVGGGVAATSILHQQGGEELLEGGAGLSLHAGLRVNRSLALEAGWIGTLHNPVAVNTAFGDDTDYLVLNGFTADAKIYLRSSNPRIEPYLQGGVGIYLLDSDYFGTQSVGTGFQAGGGLDFKLGRRVELGVRALYRGMSMGPPQQDYNDTYVGALTAEGSLGIRF